MHYLKKIMRYRYMPTINNCRAKTVCNAALSTLCRVI